MSIIVKDPSSVLDYTLDWKTDEYLGSTDAITASTWSIDPGSSAYALGVVHSTYDSTAGTTSITLSTGVHAVLYKVTNRITFGSTALPYNDERSFYIKVWEPR